MGLFCHKMIHKIIIAEDKEKSRIAYIGIIEDLLGKGNVEIDEVEEGNSLVEKVRVDSSYDLIITDNYMPGGIYGIDAVKLIREFNKNIPICMITGDDHLGDKEILEAGVDIIIRRESNIYNGLTALIERYF